ncbi:MAG: Fic family protein [Bdellovibrionales bacterium]|nr:Fic family protein [Bdellovibrionales bacterium]
MDGLKTYRISLEEVTSPQGKNFLTEIKKELAGTLEGARWADALGYVENRKTGFDLHSLLEVHERVTKGTVFENARQRRALVGEPADVDLSGRLRDHQVDTYVTQGDHIDGDGRRYFLASELEGYLQNPFFLVSTRETLKTGSQRVRATVRFVSPSHVRAVTEQVLATAKDSLARAGTRNEKLITLFQLYRALVSIHPFVDGNGRAIRLYVIALLKKEGFPTEYFPRLPEYETPTSRILKEYIAGNGLE